MKKKNSMKKMINLLLITVVVMTSCEKFLDVQPRSQVELDKMLTDEKGFQDALSGIYMQMRHADAYGERMTQGTIENLTSSWDATSGSVQQKLGNFAYEDASVDTAMAKVFSKEYNMIAHTNALLNNIDSKKAAFKTAGLYELIKGEALALRAYFHLDLLRLFGPIPTDPGQGNRLAYVTQFSSSINAHISFEEYRAHLLADINEAAGLLKDIDPIKDWSLAQLRIPNPNTGGGFRTENEFFAYRGIRMNYYAVRALMARAQLWFGNKEEAYQAAKEVIDAKNIDPNNNITPKFRLGDQADFVAGDYVLREEQIFGLHDLSMYDWYGTRYGNGTYRKGTTVTTVRNTLYGNNTSDIRWLNLWFLYTNTSGGSAHTLRKYLVRDPGQVNVFTDYKQIPMLRSSEMYLIVAETASFAEGISVFKQFRNSRGIGTLADPTTPEALKDEIIKEYRKEFYAEGQGFFAYKRNNVPKTAFVFAPGSATVVINYLPPLPYVEPIGQ